MAASTDEVACPRCGVSVKKGVLRCRDCGEFIDQSAKETGTRKQAWPGLPEDAAQRAAEAAASNAKAPRPERSEEELLHDMSFAETLFRQTEERIQSVSARSKDEDFLLDVTPVSAEKHVRTLKTSRPPAKESSPRQPSDVKPLADEAIESLLRDNPVLPSAPQASARSPVAKEKIGTPPPTLPPSVSPVSPAVEPPVEPQFPVADYPLAQSLYPLQPQTGYVDPYAGYPGYTQGAMPGYPPAAYPGGEYPQNPPDYSAYQQYGYGDYSAAGYPPGTYPPQYDPNYAAQYGYALDPSGQYVVDPSQQYPIEPLPMAVEGTEAAEPLPALDAEAPADEIPLAAVPENTTEVAPAAEAEAAAPAPAAAVEAPVKSHSEETAGDVLLAAALEEESKRGSGTGDKKTRSSESKAGLMVYCPYGHRVQIQAKFRGKAGRCPLCKVTFFVPADLEGSEPEVQAASPAAPVSQDQRVWQEDLHLHRVSPAKVKFTPGSLSEDYDTVDVGFNAEGILVTTVFKAGGLFRGMQEPKKKPVTRKAVREHLAAGKPLDQIPAPHQFQLKSDALTQIKMLQPPKPGEESMFTGVPVFGEGRIAIRIPAPMSDGAEQRWCLSFSLTQFREFCRQLVRLHGLADFSNTCGVPLEDQFAEVQCGFSNAVLRVLEQPEFYQADPGFQVETIGRKCQGCGVVVSESVRQEHKIGGKADSSVAKSKCPKCQQKFGDNKLFGLKPPESVAPPAESATPVAGSPAAPDEASLAPTSSEAKVALPTDGSADASMSVSSEDSAEV